MLIPSIDLMGGKVVQLVRGQKKALEYDSFEPWVERFSKYKRVQLIDLDAAMRQGDNRALVAQIASRLPCQVGGGIRSIADAQQMLAAGARAVIIGSALVRDGLVNVEFAKRAAEEIGADKLIFAVDSKGGKVTIAGWKQPTAITALEMMNQLEPYCGGWLYTHVDTEGMLKGIPMDVIRELRAATKRRLIAAGGISSNEEIDELDRMGVDAVVGMAIYTGKIKA
ncbi:MAG: HisA/HisF-related TIM barrel protein [Terriglobales bacterium]